MLDYALRLYDQGIITVPVKADKRPTVNWGSWYKQAPERVVFETAWRNSPGVGLAVLCGRIELLEADVKNDPTHDIHTRLYQALKDNLDAEVFNSLYIQKSPSGGYHFWYKVLEGEEHGNYPDLARIEYSEMDRFELDLPAGASNIGVIVETRGYGGYALIAPSPNYEVMQGSIENLPTLSSEDHELVLMVGRMFNQFEPQEIVYQDKQVQPTFGSRRPGDIYNEQMGPTELLSLVERYGFRRLRQLGENIFLGRPGAKNPHKHDAKINMRLNCFVNFSSSVGMFAPMKGYSPFYVYANLVHNGDFKEATKDLAGKGFSDKPTIASTIWQPVIQAEAPEVTMDEDALFLASLEKDRFSIEKRPNIQFNFFFVSSTGFYQPVGFPGALITIQGAAKSRKTTLLGLIIASVLAERRVLNAVYNGGGRVLWIDTEQGEMYFWETMWRVHVQSRLTQDEKDRLYSYCWADKDPSERVSNLKRLIRILQPAVVILDGIVDFMYDINSIPETQALIQVLRGITSQGITVFPIIHENPNGGANSKARGHIGTWLANKSDCVIGAKGDIDDEARIGVRNVMSRGPKFKHFDLFAGKDGILMEDSMPNYDFTIGKPERVKKEDETVAIEITQSPDVFSHNRANFAEEDIF